MRLQPYDDVIKNLGVTVNASLARNFYKDPTSGLFIPVTHCNAYANSFFAAQGIHVPPSLSANDLYDWFLGKTFAGVPTAADCGWRSPVDLATALGILKADGHVCACGNEPGGHGHIAPLIDPPSNDPGSAYVSAAGGTNFAKATIGKSFGNLQYLLFPHN